MADTLSKRIKTARYSKGLSLRDLAEMAGVSIGTIQRLEAGKTRPYGQTVFRLAESLDLDLDELIDLLEKDGAAS